MSAAEHVLKVWMLRTGLDFEFEATVECRHEDSTRHHVWWACLEHDQHDEDDLEETGMAHGLEHQRFDGHWMTEGTTCYAVTVEGGEDSLFEMIRDNLLVPGTYDIEYDADEFGPTWMLAYAKGERILSSRGRALVGPHA